MNKIIEKAKKGTTTGKSNSKESKKSKKTPTPYNLFVKEKYPEVKDQYEPKERMKAIAILWKKHQESSNGK